MQKTAHIGGDAMAEISPSEDPKNMIMAEEPRDVGFFERLLISDRKLSFANILLMVCATIGISLAIYHVYVAAFGTPEGRSFRSIHLSGMLILAYLGTPLGRSSITAPLDSFKAKCGFGVDLLLIALVIFVQAWTLWDIEAFHLRYGNKDPDDMLLGGLLILAVLEATRRVVGWAMVIITGFFIFHALYAHYFIGIFYGPPVRIGKFIDTLFMSSDGLFGIPLYVCATYIALFIIFGALLIRSNAGRFFIHLAVSLTGHKIGGPAKASAVASGFMGTVSGSAVANVVTTGSFTIPMMKKVGYRPKFAAAVEACASSGGQITPPIMGAAAFIIAEFMGVPYVDVIIAAFIPALLYFVTIYFMVHLEAEKHNVARIPKEHLPNTAEVLKNGWYLLIALAVLVGLLLYGYTPMKSAFYGILALIGLSFLSPTTRMSAVDIFAALESGIKATVPVSIACACAGLIIGAVFVSGLGLKFTQSVINIADGNLLLLLALTGVAAIILGMGITTTAVYITVAALIVPAVIKAGVEPMAAHMFAFYFGVVSTITPPVALASFAAAAISKTPPMATAFESTRVGITKYLAPLIFVYNPSLLFIGPLWLTVISTILALFGLWILSIAMEGWYRGKLDPMVRLGFLVSAIFLLIPPVIEMFGLPGYGYNIVGVIGALGFIQLRYQTTKQWVSP